MGRGREEDGDEVPAVVTAPTAAVTLVDVGDVIVPLAEVIGTAIL